MKTMGVGLALMVAVLGGDRVEAARHCEEASAFESVVITDAASYAGFEFADVPGRKIVIHVKRVENLVAVSFTGSIALINAGAGARKLQTRLDLVRIKAVDGRRIVDVLAMALPETSRVIQGDRVIVPISLSFVDTGQVGPVIYRLRWVAGTEDTRMSMASVPNVFQAVELAR